jgi:hypothetical protein
MVWSVTVTSFLGAELWSELKNATILAFRLVYNFIYLLSAAWHS